MSSISTFWLETPIQPEAWLLDVSVTFLNHGSFGACPLPVLEKQQELRLALEREPVEFLARRLPPLLDESRCALAKFLKVDPADLVFVQNATAGVNAVLRSLKFQPGDEILVTNHDYHACRNVVCHVAEQSGAKVVEVCLPLPIHSPAQIVAAVLERVTSRTRLAVLDHITSPTALVFPIQELVAELDRRGVDTLVDGAHAPGMVSLNLQRLGAAYYTGNCHKWLCAPKGAGFLYIRRDRQSGIKPLIISHGWDRHRPDHTPFQDAFDWPGTFDPTAWLCVGAAIRFLETLLPDGLLFLMQRNHNLAVRARDKLCRRLGATPVGPDEMLGSMAAMVLPDEIAGGLTPNQSHLSTGEHPLHDMLFLRRNIEVPVFFWPDPSQTILRISAQAYNYAEQYDRLADALEEIVAEAKQSRP